MTGGRVFCRALNFISADAHACILYHRCSGWLPQIYKNTKRALCCSGARLSPSRGVAKRSPHREHLYETTAYQHVRSRFRANLRRIRRSRKLTHEQAGGLCGMTMQQFQMLESGDANLTFRTVSRIVEGLSIDVSELFAPLKSSK